MKKYLIISVSIFIIFSFGCSPKKSTDDNIAKLLPAQSDILIKLGSIESIFNSMAVTDNSIFGNPVKEVTFIEAQLGFNPLKIDDLKAKGFDVEKELGIAVSNIEFKPVINKKPAINAEGLLMIPVTSAETFLEFITDTIKKMQPETDISTIDGRTVIKPEGKTSIIFMEKNNYMLITVDDMGGDSNSLLDAILDNKSSLYDEKNYQQITSFDLSGQGFFLYLNLAKVAEKNLKNILALTDNIPAEQVQQMEKGLQYIKDYSSAGFSIDLTSSDFNIKSVVTMKPDSQTIKIMQGNKSNKDVILGVDKNPLLLISFALNLQEYYQTMIETLPPDQVNEFKLSLAKIKEETGFNIEKDIIQNISGSFNLGVYDAANLNAMNINSLISIGIIDELKIKELINTAINMIPEEQVAIQKEKVAGIDAYAISAGFFKIFMGITDNNMILTFGQPMFEAGVNGNSSSGFLSKIDDPQLKDILQNDSGIFYLNIDELFKAQESLTNVLGFLSKIDQKVLEAASNFKYILFSNNLEGNALVSNFIIKTRFQESFSLGIKKLISMDQ